MFKKSTANHRSINRSPEKCTVKQQSHALAESLQCPLSTCTRYARFSFSVDKTERVCTSDFRRFARSRKDFRAPVTWKCCDLYRPFDLFGLTFLFCLEGNLITTEWQEQKAAGLYYEEMATVLYETHEEQGLNGWDIFGPHRTRLNHQFNTRITVPGMSDKHQLFAGL
ncbi:hypothetical protein JTB14_032575 [Gonioctena quinquepunctata]|nr:hypothetical protein JTB14_032575 [Gonioctena quinquepunctata]